jgi:hypothetical protein
MIQRFDRAWYAYVRCSNVSPLRVPSFAIRCSWVWYSMVDGSLTIDMSEDRHEL